MNRPPAAVADASVWIVDLDGVLWLAGHPIGDVAAAVRVLRDRSVRVVFATNNSSPTTGQLVDRLAKIGIEVLPRDLVTSAQVAASLLEPGQRVHLLAEAGVLEALEDRGVVVVNSGPRDAAVVGWSRHFDFDALAAISMVARDSGRLIATNGDPTHPTPEGLMPGSGALLAAVATASGVVPEVAGKPHQPMIDYLARHILGGTKPLSAVMVGDQPGTDGVLADRLGIPFVLVDSGVTPAGQLVGDCPVALRASDFVSVVASLLPT
jgi:HAD superfamily hydrolase (TIGR01450 family)